MKKFMFVLLIMSLYLSVSNIEAGRKRSPKSGKIKNSIYTDSKYNFQVTLLEGWKGKTKKEKSTCRVDITCEEYKKSDLHTFGFGTSSFELLIPMVSVWVIETDLTSKEYLKAFLKNPKSTPLNEKILRSMQATWADMIFINFKTMNSNKISANKREGVSWSGVVKSHFRADGMDGEYPTTVIVDCIENNDNELLFIVGRAELKYFNIEANNMKQMMRSIKWLADTE